MTTETIKRKNGAERSWLGRVLLISAAALGLALCWSQKSNAATLNGGDQNVNVTEVTNPDTTGVINLCPEMENNQDVQSVVTGSTGEEIAYVLEAKETKNHPIFNIEPWVCYSTDWWDVSFISRISWSGEVLPGVSVYWHVDLKNKLKDPTKMEWVSWKFTSSVNVWGWATINYDHTLTWWWDNIFRWGVWYKWKIWGVNYNVIVNPLNSNGSSLSGKLAVSGKVWKNWNISSFIFVDSNDSGKDKNFNFGNVSCYSETQYTQNITDNLGVYGWVRLTWSPKWITNMDVVWWVRYIIK